MLTFIIPRKRKLPERQVGVDAFLLESRGSILASILPSFGQHPESSWAWPAVGVMTRRLPSPHSPCSAASLHLLQRRQRCFQETAWQGEACHCRVWEFALDSQGHYRIHYNYPHTVFITAFCVLPHSVKKPNWATILYWLSFVPKSQSKK